MEWPLSGLRVADLSAGIACGYCTKVLADGGAEVIKLDRRRPGRAAGAATMLPGDRSHAWPRADGHAESQRCSQVPAAR